MKCTPEKRAALIAISSKRIGMAGYAEILSSVRFRALSSRQLADKHGVDIKTIHSAMRYFLKAKLVHRVNWFRPTPHSRLVPCWAFGGAGDISIPSQETRVAKPRPAHGSVVMISTVLSMLDDHAHTFSEIAEALCMHYESATRIVNTLRAVGLVYVASWHKPPMGTSVAEFRTGSGRDAPRPPRVGNSVASMAGYKARRKQLAMLQALAGVPQQAMRAAA